jgi:hypothetical protein
MVDPFSRFRQACLALLQLDLQRASDEDVDGLLWKAHTITNDRYRVLLRKVGRPSSMPTTTLLISPRRSTRRKRLFAGEFRQQNTKTSSKRVRSSTGRTRDGCLSTAGSKFSIRSLRIGERLPSMRKPQIHAMPQLGVQPNFMTWRPTFLITVS